MYLDMSDGDIMDSTFSRHTKGQGSADTLDSAIAQATHLFFSTGAKNGQIGIFTKYHGDCLGYVVKWDDEDEPVFLELTDE